MFYRSTRGEAEPVTAPEAIKMGIAPDGGLFVPARTVQINYKSLTSAGYHEYAAAILKPYLPEFAPGQLREWIDLAYSSERFDHPAVAPLVKAREGLYFLELWHGPTAAFKDIALQILPYLLSSAIRKTGEEKEVVILVATSGDTGKAALEGFRDVPGTRVVVFYPQMGVSEMQRLQMVTQEGGNLHVAAVRGDFDDAQSGVKAIFADQELKTRLLKSGCLLSSANSINWGRLVPQIVYYYSAYLDLLHEGTINSGEPVNFVVPTGNFGNILAGFYARCMGLPVRRLICAANSNRVLADFIRSGVYNANRALQQTISPSMDILISSNLERLLFELSGQNAARIREWMKQLSESGSYTVDPFTASSIGELFWSDFAGDDEAIKTISKLYREYGYLIDPHTAVGAAVYEKYLAATGDHTQTVIISTASPFKFNECVARALFNSELSPGRRECELPELIAQKTGCPIPAGLRGLDRRPVLHDSLIDKSGMRKYLLGLRGER